MQHNKTIVPWADPPTSFGEYGRGSHHHSLLWLPRKTGGEHTRHIRFMT